MMMMALRRATYIGGEKKKNMAVVYIHSNMIRVGSSSCYAVNCRLNLNYSFLQAVKRLKCTRRSENCVPDSRLSVNVSKLNAAFCAFNLAIRSFVTVLLGLVGK